MWTSWLAVRSSARKFATSHLNTTSRPFPPAPRSKKLSHSNIDGMGASTVLIVVAADGFLSVVVSRRHGRNRWITHAWYSRSRMKYEQAGWVILFGSAAVSENRRDSWHRPSFWPIRAGRNEDTVKRISDDASCSNRLCMLVTTIWRKGETMQYALYLVSLVYEDVALPLPVW